jgi:hypothetical protein
MKVLRFLGQLLGAAIGAAILWASMPLFIIVLSAVGAFFEAYMVFVIVMFPVFIVASVIIAIYESRKRRKVRY